MSAERRVAQRSPMQQNVNRSQTKIQGRQAGATGGGFVDIGRLTQHPGGRGGGTQMDMIVPGREVYTREMLQGNSSTIVSQTSHKKPPRSQDKYSGGTGVTGRGGQNSKLNGTHRDMAKNARPVPINISAEYKKNIMNNSFDSGGSPTAGYTPDSQASVFNVGGGGARQGLAAHHKTSYIYREENSGLIPDNNTPGEDPRFTKQHYLSRQPPPQLVSGHSQDDDDDELN